jgi:hypothetical protein
MTAPLESTTLPEIEDAVAPCPYALVQKTNNASPVVINARTMPLIRSLPSVNGL